MNMLQTPFSPKHLDLERAAVPDYTLCATSAVRHEPELRTCGSAVSSCRRSERCPTPGAPLALRTPERSASATAVAVQMATSSSTDNSNGGIGAICSPPRDHRWHTSGPLCSPHLREIVVR
jgi:hypothetical protein